MPHGMMRTIAAVLFTLLTLETQGVERIVYYHNDALGLPIAATDAHGNLLWRESYAPYGQRLLKQAGSQEQLLYTGKAEESTFGIQDFGSRWSQTGRFLSIDPAGFDPQNLQSFNRYAYANNNPYGFVDPDGRAPKVPYQMNFDLGIGGGGSYGMGYGRTSRAQAPPRTTSEGVAEAAGDAARAADRTVIGKLKDIKADKLQPGEKTLLDSLPDQGNVKANWKQNSSVLRQESRKGQPIRDASVDSAGNLRDNTGFLRAERNL